MKRLRLLCIPPYEGMYNLLTNIAAQRSDVELVIHMGNLQEGLRAALKNQDETIDAILSRGGTTEAIRCHSDIPVCDILPSVYDVLRTIRLAQGVGEPFAVVGFPSITRPAAMLFDILQYDCAVYTIHSEEECRSVLESLQNQGIRLVVGDMIVTLEAKKYNMHGLLIVSGIESVENAIATAKDMCLYNATLRKREELFSALLAEEDHRVMVYLSDGTLYFSTIQTLPEEIAQTLRDRVGDVLSQGAVKLLRHVGSQTWAIQGKLLSSGGEEYCIYTIYQRDMGSELLDRHMIRYLSAGSDLPSSSPIEYYLGSSEIMADLRESCERYSRMNVPVLIEGPPGTGKDRFAHYIYTHSRLRHSSFVLIDAGLLTEKGWDFLLESDISPLTDAGLSIYFRAINAAPAQFQRRLWLYLKNSGTMASNRLFFSRASGIQTPVQEDLYLYLTETIHALRLYIPPLSQHREDIPKLVGLYINATNVHLGTRVIGFTREAMLTVQNHDWERNVDQLVQLVQDLVSQAKSSYISQDQLKNALRRENPPAVSTQAPLDLSRSLDEITREVVLRVYAEENMSQTRTAKRLNISRSTLWRMLK